MRAGMVVLGLALGVLWVVGLSYGATNWLVWLDFVAAIVSLGSVLVPERMPQALRATPFALAGGLFVLWIIGMAVDATRWMSWWTFAFGVAYLLLGASATSTLPTAQRRPSGPTGVTGSRI